MAAAARYALNPLPFLQHRRAYRERNPIKESARGALRNAIRAGLIVRPATCQSCAVRCKPQAHHHHGYDRPLDVIFLCSDCHWAAERAMKFHQPTAPFGVVGISMSRTA